MKSRHQSKRSRQTPKLATTREISELRPFLDGLMASYHQTQWLSSDPVQYPHRYSRPADREVVAFISACFAYGSVVLIHRAVQAILAPLGDNPAEFVRNYDGRNLWPGFYHRFHTDEHVVVLLKLLSRALREYGSLGELFRRNAEAGDGDGDGDSRCEQVLNGAARWLREEARREVEMTGRPELLRGMKFLFNAPADGSACKRMVMFLRWMVRKDEIDLGLWGWFAPAELVVPADTHVARISYYIGLRGGREDQPANWKMAREITESLKVVNPEDPVSYDFALARLGILDICKRTYTKSICERCPIRPCCRFSNESPSKGKT